MSSSRISRRASLAAALVLTAFALASPAAAQTAAPNRAPSPNGKIVYTSNERGVDSSHDQIWVMNADGRSKTRLTATDASDGSPVFSPDGQSIAFSRSNGDTRLYVMKADGTNQTTAGAPPPGFSTGVNKIEWSPDGRKVKYENFGGAWVQQVFNADGSVSDAEPVNVSTNAQNLRWSADGTKLLYFWPGSLPEKNVMLPRGIYTVNADGTGRTMWTSVSIDVDDARPSWVAGGRVAFKAVGAGGRYDIFVFAPGVPGSLVNVTNTSEHDELGPVPSPDGTKLALFWDDGTTSGVGVVNVSAPGAPLHLAELVSAAGGFGFNDTLIWSPDGTQIIYQDDVASHQTGTLANSTEIYVVDADGGRESNYTKTRRFTEKAGNWQRVAVQ